MAAATELNEQTVVVTGGTAGIGLQTALGVAAVGPRVVVTGRNAERARAATDLIRRQTGNDKTIFAIADLASASGVDSLATRSRGSSGAPGTS